MNLSSHDKNLSGSYASRPKGRRFPHLVLKINLSAMCKKLEIFVVTISQLMVPT